MKNTDKSKIDILVNKLNGSTIWAYGFYLKYRFGKNDNIASNYTHGFVGESEIISLIHKSISFTFIQWLIPRIVNLIDSICFTDKVIDACIDYPATWRDTLLEVVGHKTLSVEGWTRINRLMHTPEAFNGLLIHYLTQNVDVDTFNVFLKENNRFRTEFVEHGQYIVEKYQNADNKELIRILYQWQRD